LSQQLQDQGEGTWVVVTTEHRGVFLGRLPAGQDRGAKALTLSGVQMCVYWSSDVRGVLGLAVSGPTRSCKVTRGVPGLTTLQGVTAVFDATGEAVDAWQDRPWS
jgi:hypothetical protein